MKKDEQEKSSQKNLFEGIDDKEKQKEIDRLLKVSKEAEEFFQLIKEEEDRKSIFYNEVNEIVMKILRQLIEDRRSHYDDELNEIKVQDEKTKERQIGQKIKLSSDQTIKKKPKLRPEKLKKKKKVPELSSNESSSENGEFERKKTSGKGKLRPGQKAKSSKPLNLSDPFFKININAKDWDNLSNFICKQCQYLAKDIATLKSHQLFNHQFVKVGQKR